MPTIAAPPSTSSILNYPPNFPAGIVNPAWLAWFTSISANVPIFPTFQTGYAIGWDAGGNLVNVPNTGSDQTAFFANTTNAVQGAGAVGYNPALSYAASTVGAQLNTIVTTYAKISDLAPYALSADLADQAHIAKGASLIGYLAPYTGAVGRTQQRKNTDYPTVLDFSADPTGVADSTTAINAAITGLIAQGKYRLRLPSGTYKVAAANGTTPVFSIPDSFTLEGEGSNTILQRTDSFNVATILLNGARSTVRDLRLIGAGSADPFTGYGIQIGDTTFSGIYYLTNVRCFNFNIGFRFRGALWTNLYDCWAENNAYGLAYDATGSNNSTSTYCVGCTFRGNTRNGIAGLSVPVRNLGLSLINCNVEANGSLSPATYPQIQPGAMGNLTILNGYYESTAATKPDTIDLTNCGDFSIQGAYFNGANRHIFATGAISYGTIQANRFLATAGTNAVELLTPNTQVYAFANESDKPINISGASSCSIAGKLTDTTAEDLAFPTAPVLYGKSTAGAPTYSIQSGRYSKIGNQCRFRIRISITALGGIAGPVYIKNLPFLSANSTLCYELCQVSTNGVTLSGSNTYVYGIINPNTSEIEIMQDGSATGGADIQGTALAAATTLIVSGTYTTA